MYDPPVPPALEIIRKSSFSATPWKNGGGTTHEAIRVPPAGDAFLWRVSVAHIDASGPFSDFTGYRRYMVLLRGSGLTLTFGNGDSRALRRIGEWLEFDGAAHAHCDLLAGPCVDLNFMVSKQVQAEARVLRLDESLTLQAPPTALIFAIETPLSLAFEYGGSARLEPWDLAVISQGLVRLSGIEPAKFSAPSAVFFATIGH